MAVSKIECPECGAMLRLAKRPEPGKKIRCPKCEKTFPVPAEDDDEKVEAPAPKKKAAKSEAISKKAAPKKPSKPNLAPSDFQTGDDEDEEGGTYAFEKSKEEEEEEDEKKPKIDYAPDLTVKDPRGPAVAKLTIPTNALIAHGAMLFFGGVFVFLFGLWPFIFSKYIVTPRQTATNIWEERNPGTEDDPPFTEEKTEEEFRQSGFGADVVGNMPHSQQIARWEQDTKDKKRLHILLICLGPVASLYGGVIVLGAVWCQQLTGWTWGFIAACMAIPTGIAGSVLLIYLGIKKTEWAWYVRIKLGLGGVGEGVSVLWPAILLLIRLQKPEIQEGFVYKPKY